MGKIRFSIPGYDLRYPYPVCKKHQSATIFTSVKYLLIFIMVPELRYVEGFTQSNIKSINEGYNLMHQYTLPYVSILN